MIVTYLRSSSYNSWDFCRFRYYIEYILGFKQEPNKKAEKGSITHKTLELLALESLATKNNQDYIVDPEVGKFNLPLNVKATTKKVYDYYVKDSPNQFFKLDYEECLEWVEKALNYKGGICDPRNLDVIAAEQFFDIEFKEDWAKYTYELPDGEILCDYFSIKGNIDLITKIDDDTIEFVDYKTGKRINWSTMEEKDENKLKEDPQLLLYYLALRTLYPDKHIILSIFFINDGGIFSIYFDDTDLVKAKSIVRARFEEIKRTYKPRRVRETFRCKKFCQFRKGNDLCEKIHSYIEKEGMDRALEKFSNGYELINQYAEGGGRKQSG